MLTFVFASLAYLLAETTADSRGVHVEGTNRYTPGMSDNPYAAPPTLPFEDSSTKSGFDPQLLKPSLWIITAVATAAALMFCIPALYCLMVVAMIFGSSQLDPEGYVAIIVLVATTFALAGSWLYLTYRIWSYRSVVRQLVAGSADWQRFTLAHRRMWEAVLILVLVFAGIVALILIGQTMALILY